MKLHERMEAVFNTDLDSATRIILLCLAWHAKVSETVPVWPSVRTIAKATGLNKDTVTHRLDWLRKRGLIVREAQHGFRRSDRHVVKWAELSDAVGRPTRPDANNISRIASDQTGRECPTGSDTVSDGFGRCCPTASDGTVNEPSIEPRVEPRCAESHPVDPEHAQPVDDDRPSRPALPPVPATDDGRPADGEGLPLAHAPTPPAALRGSDAAGGGGEPAKKRKRAAQPAGPSAADLDAWSDCAILWQQISGKARALNADAGAGRSLAEAIAKVGARRMLARLEGAKVDAWVKSTFETKEPISLVALCRHDLPWLDRLEAAGEEILSAREASAPVDWRATLDRWVQTPDTHPGLAEPALWTTLRAAAIAQGARGDAPAVLRWLADPVNRSATLAALTEPEKPATPAGPRVRTWEEVLESCRTQGSAGLSVAEYGVVTDVGRAADGRGDLVAYVGNASGDMAIRMRRYAAHLARGRVTVLAVVA